MRSFSLCLLLAFALTGNANAGIIFGSMNVDNKHSTFISTDDSEQGIKVASGEDWQQTDTFEYELDAGVDYFLHVFAQDLGGIAGFLGEFSLTGNSHEFVNGSNHILTNADDWTLGLNGWGSVSEVSVINGSNGVAPWGEIAGIDAAAQWIWHENAHNQEQVYFSLAIKALPVNEPYSVAVLALAALLINSRRSS